MTTEYGLFNAEGCLERSMWSQAEADARLAELVGAGEIDQDEDRTTAEPMCNDHEERPARSCEECFAEEDAEETAGDG